mgnify:CR=1 FL=1
MDKSDMLKAQSLKFRVSLSHMSQSSVNLNLNNKKSTSQDSTSEIEVKGVQKLKEQSNSPVQNTSQAHHHNVQPAVQ